MKYDFVAVDTHTATLQNIVHGLETNLQNIQTLKNQLLADFAGAGATGYQSVTDTLNRKMDQYNTTLQGVKAAIAQTAGSDGLMRTTDTNNGNRFLSIGA